jgi:hypothetical protein
VPYSFIFWSFHEALGVSFVPKKSPKSFTAFGLRLVLIFCEVKKKQKTTTGTGHYVNRLVPKNDMKLLVNVYKTFKIDTLIAWNNKKL